MENVVYILGAGFSAPLDLPVMSNFIEKAKDLYFNDSKKYAHFDNIFKRIERMSYVKNFYNTNLLNIEEILSILEMESQIKKRKTTSFQELIIDVIKYYTPIKPDIYFEDDKRHVKENESFVNMTMKRIFNSYNNNKWLNYSYFVLSLFNIKFYHDYKKRELANHTKASYEINSDSRFKYDIITLNYDLVLETVCEILNDNFRESKIQFSKDTYLPNSKNPYLSKLHGCIGTQEIIPPTWNKGLRSKSILTAWKNAYEILQNAQHIRIIGYSLPVNDSYIKYLLRSAVLNNRHLKRIDILCKKEKDNSYDRYNEFVDFINKRFVYASTEVYLEEYNNLYQGGSHELPFNKLEEFHNTFFRRNSI